MPWSRYSSTLVVSPSELSLIMARLPLRMALALMPGNRLGMPIWRPICIIFYARPVKETILASFLHWLCSQDLTSKELVDILRRCQEEDYMEVMQKAPNHVDSVEIQDTVIVQAVDPHLYNAFIYGKAGAAI
mgnify:CR=1 FL=1